MLRYHFEIRTAASRDHPGQTFTPAFYADSVDEAEAVARRSYPSAVRVALVDVDRGYRRESVVADPTSWQRVANAGRRFA